MHPSTVCCSPKGCRRRCALLTCLGSLKCEFFLGDFCTDGCACSWLQVTVAASLEWEWYGCCIGSPLSSHLVLQPACGFIPAVQLWLVTESRGPQEGEKSKGLIFSLNAKLHCEAILSQKGLNKAERHSLAHCSG